MLIWTISSIPEIGTASQEPRKRGRGNACPILAAGPSVQPKEALLLPHPRGKPGLPACGRNFALATSPAPRATCCSLRAYRGHGGLICPSHETLAERVDCHTSTVWRALQAARDLGLVRWTERRVRAGWRSLRTSNRYRLLMPDGPVAPCPAHYSAQCWRRESKNNQEAHERDHAGLATMLAGAARLPDLLAARRAAWEAGMRRR